MSAGTSKKTKAVGGFYQHVYAALEAACADAGSVDRPGLRGLIYDSIDKLRQDGAAAELIRTGESISLVLHRWSQELGYARAEPNLRTLRKELEQHTREWLLLCPLSRG